jgi:hypothetical protein
LTRDFPALLRLAALVFVTLLAMFVSHGPARAQSCHAPALREADGASFRAELSAFVAGYDQDGVRGSYQGGSVLLGFVHRWIALEAGLPYYHLTRDGEDEHGIGDVLVGAHVPVFRRERDGLERLALGPELVATLPSGDGDAGLGMGHVMLMPGAFARLRVAQLTLQLQVAYGVALDQGHDHAAAAEDPHAHHAGHADHQVAAAHSEGPAPIVNPMNRSELEHTLSAAYRFSELFAVTARVAGAVPIDDEQGEVRETVAFGVRFTFGAFDLGVEQELPLVGDPFRYRSVLRAGGQW